ncbi:alpha-L-fucosidase [Paraflavitalea sp. CAU 1676]|uniref:alpha-L-fucosidase n=1 Tax=Paraflavitalea sp. CAU 1676 TaxID=3032598 RepID=UPI0023DA7716|nr:alpha-L-fucosidase [Paraflavitalea sp. CAU 1676]MDF2193487.1 alpha-L-fucosidase [Paraflavitalea sp. CAU 1676]
MKRIITTVSLALLVGVSVSAQQPEVPYFLQAYKKQYKKDPRAATMQWFVDARYGLFVHWGASSMYQSGDWVLYNKKLPLQPYIDSALKFKGEKWNADSITDLAVKAEMKYVTYVVKHHDGFAQFDSKAGPFNSMQAAAKRDFLKEMAVACKKRGLGLFVYYSIGIDWTHPFYLTRKDYNAARPDYATMPAEIRSRGKEDFVHYWNYVKTHIYEICTNYGPLAGLWFDPVGGAYTNSDVFDLPAIYAMIRRLQPHALISYKTGFNGDEDYISCEHDVKSITDLMRKVQGEKTAQAAEAAWQKNRNKLAELNTTMQDIDWGYHARAKHKTVEQVMALLQEAADNNANLLLNIGPYPDGSIVPADRETLLEVGRIIRRQGLPKQDKVNYMKLRGDTKPITARDLETQK